MEAAWRRRAAAALLVAGLLCCPGMAKPDDSPHSSNGLPLALFLLSPPAQHVEHLTKRQAVYEATVDDQHRPQLELSIPAEKDVRKPQPEAVNTPILLRPIIVAKFYPELQPGYGHDDSLGADDSYAFVPNADSLADLQNSSPGTPPDYSHQQLTHSQPRLKKSSMNLKKLLNKPKKMMKVMTATEEGEMVPKAVPGVMLPIDDGHEDTFVPAELLEHADTLLTSGSTLNPTVVLPSHGEAPMKGMPFNFAYIVDDEATENFQTRQEEGDKQGVVTGCFQVLDPNGLVRTTTYRADDTGFHIISLTRSPDKTPCPGLDDATRSPVPLPAPTGRPSPASYGQNNNGAYANNLNSFGRFSAASSSSSSSSQENSSSSSSQYNSNSFNVNNGFINQASVARTAKESVSKEELMAQYLQEITKNLYNSYTNSSSITENQSSTNNAAYNTNNENFINFPFVLIPIKTFLDLQKSGAISDDVQSYGAFVQPQPYQVNGNRQQQQQQQQQQQRQQQKQYTVNKTTKQTSSNTYNAAQSNSQQAAYRSQGVNNGFQQGYGQQGGRSFGQQRQQYQSNQSSQSSKKSSSSSSSSSSSQQAGYQGANTGYRPTAGYGQQGSHALGQQQYQRHQASQSSQKSSSSSNSSNQQSAYLSQGINSGHQRALNRGQQGNQALGHQQQYQSQQSSQSAKKSSSSSSSSSSNSFSAYGNQQGYAGPSSQGSGTRRPTPTYGTPTLPGYVPPKTRTSPPKPIIPTTYQPRPQQSTSRPAPYQPQPHQSTRTPARYQPQLQHPTNFPAPARYQPQPHNPTNPPAPSPLPTRQQAFNYNNGGVGGSRFFSQNSQSSQKASQASQEQQQQQAFSGVNFNNGLAAQSFHAASSKSASANKSSKSASSSSQYIGNNGQLGGAVRQGSSNYKSSSSSSSSSASSSEKSSSSFVGGFAFGQGGQSHSFPQLAPYEPQPAPSTLSSAVLPSPPSPAPRAYNAIATPDIKVPTQHALPQPNLISSAAPYQVEAESDVPDYSLFSPPAAEPTSGMEGWTPITTDYNSPEEPATQYQTLPPPSSQGYDAATDQNNNNADYYGGNNNNYNFNNQNNNDNSNFASFTYSDQSSSRQSSSSQQSHQQSSAVWAEP